jgi:DNA mismatch repair ATPase MutS
MSAQEPANPPPHPRSATDPDEDVRLPNGKLQKDEILKADFQKSLDEARELSKLADQLKADLEKNDRYVLSIPTLKKAEDIEKLAKRIHDRMKHY